MNKGVALTLGTAVISGVSIFVNAFGVKGVNPDIFTFTKNILVAVVLVCILLAARQWKEIRKLNAKDWKLLVSIGFIGGSVPFVLFFRGLQLTTAANSSLIQKTLFVFVAIFAFFFLKENVKKHIVPGVLLLIGNILLLNLAGFRFVKADLLILAATVFWAAENVLSKKATMHISGTIVAAARMGFGAVFLFGYLAAAQEARLLFTITTAQAVWILITAAFLTGYVLTWYNGIRHIPISLATMILQLGAPITIMLNWAFFGKKLLLLQIIGTALIIGATIYLTAKTSNTQRHFLHP